MEHEDYGLLDRDSTDVWLTEAASEVLDYYHLYGRFLPRSEDLADCELDPIPADIVGGINVKQLFRDVAAEARGSLTVKFLLEPLALLRGKRRAIVIPEVQRSARPWIKPSVASTLAKIRGLPLFRVYTRPIFAHCSLFEVAKKERLTRLISDARLGNHMLQRLEGFRLFKLHQLHEAIRKWGCDDVVLLDFRHHFYQIPLPVGFARFFGVEDYTAEPPVQLIPTAVPMGFHSAPCLGQSVTWAVVLARGTSSPPLGVDPSTYELPVMPEYVSLYEKDSQDTVEIGRVFVLLDGVAIFCSDEQLRHEWVNRLAENCRRYHAIIKSADGAPEGAPAIVSGRCEGGATFAGINWSAQGVRPDKDLGESPALESLQDVAHVIGSLMWAIRARGHDLLDHEDILLLSQRIGQVASERNYNYRTPFALSDEERDSLRRCWEAYRVMPRSQLPHRVPPGRKIWAVTDATPKCRAFLVYNEDGTLRSIPSDASPISAEGPQGQQELDAVLDLAKYVSRSEGCACHIFLAIDNTAAQRVVEQGYSRVGGFRATLRELKRLGHYFTTVYVPSEENAADGPSRGAPVDDDRRNKTWARLLTVLQ